MHSLFSRKQSSSTTNLAAAAAAAAAAGGGRPVLDEFGALASNDYNRSSHATTSRSVLASDKEDKKAARKRALSSGHAAAAVSSADLPAGAHLSEFAHLPDGAFFPTVVPLGQRHGAGGRAAGGATTGGQQMPEYGYIASDADVVLGLEDVLRLVTVAGRELSTRGAWKWNIAITVARYTEVLTTLTAQA